VPLIPVVMHTEWVDAAGRTHHGMQTVCPQCGDVIEERHMSECCSVLWFVPVDIHRCKKPAKKQARKKTKQRV
jgi:hypothetical protein